MKKIIITLFIIHSSLICQRYTDPLFTSNLIETNLTYAVAEELNTPYLGESFTHSSELKLDLYEPLGDTLSLRPVLINIHGGAFISGTKENEDMVEFCKEFASRGYVTAALEYRLGMNVLSNVSAERAVYRAIQDSRAAIRFLKSNASQRKIDSNHVFLLGSSAGAFMALHNVFMNETNERPQSTYEINTLPPTLNNGPDLGGFDDVALQYNGSARADAIFSLWGALQDTTLVKEYDGGTPVYLVHGTADTIVPFGVGSPFSLLTFPPTYGSSPTAQRLVNLEFEHGTYFVESEGHEFYGVFNGNWNPAPNQYWDSVLTRAVNFFYEQHKPTAEFEFNIDGMIAAFTDLSIDAIKWSWDFGDGSASSKSNPAHTYQSNGNYRVQLKVLNQIDSWDTTSQVVNINASGLAENVYPAEFSLSQNYPNPFNPTTKIQFTIPSVETSHELSLQKQFVTLIVYEILGRKIATLVNEPKQPGIHEVEFDAGNLPSGIYFYTLQAGEFRDTKKLMLLR